MRQVRVEPKKVALVSTIIFLVVFSLLLIIGGADAWTIFESAIKSGGIMFLIGLMWWWYNKYGWYRPFHGLEKWLYEGPNLNGRWEGTVCRLRGDTPHPFVLEVTQTSLGFSYNTFSRNSVGHSVSAMLMATDEEGSSYQMYSIWQTDSSDIDDANAKELFKGASVWTISVPIGMDRTSMQISDLYFTDREPPTKGKLDLKWVSENRLNKFK